MWYLIWVLAILAMCTSNIIYMLWGEYHSNCFGETDTHLNDSVK